MMYKTHLQGGVLAKILSINILIYLLFRYRVVPKSSALILLVSYPLISYCSFKGCYLPDYDLPQKRARTLFDTFVKTFICSFSNVGHRNPVSHTLSLVIFLFAPVTYIFIKMISHDSDILFFILLSVIWASFWLGWISHIVLDFFNLGGTYTFKVLEFLTFRGFKIPKGRSDDLLKRHIVKPIGKKFIKIKKRYFWVIPLPPKIIREPLPDDWGKTDSLYEKYAMNFLVALTNLSVILTIIHLAMVFGWLVTIHAL